MRWGSTIAVTLAPIAFATGAVGRAHGIANADLAGEMTPVLCLLVVCTLPLLQPRPLNATSGVPLDERETVLRLKAIGPAMVPVALPGMLLCMYMSIATKSNWWTPSSDEWRWLELVFVCWIFGMPMAFASWLTPAPLAEEDDQ